MGGGEVGRQLLWSFSEAKCCFSVVEKGIVEVETGHNIFSVYNMYRCLSSKVYSVSLEGCLKVLLVWSLEAIKGKICSMNNLRGGGCFLGR